MYREYLNWWISWGQAKIQQVSGSHCEFNVTCTVRVDQDVGRGCNDVAYICIARHDLTETTRAMVKRGSDDLKKLASLQATLVRE